MTRQAETHATEMERIAIPGTSITVSRVALGTWAIGGWMWGGTDEAQSIATIRAALDHGINLIDTAPVYGFGRAEEIVGKAIAEGGLRAKVRIASKAGLGWKDGRVFRDAGPRPHLPGDRGFAAPAAHRSHRHLSGALARPVGSGRGNRRRDGRAVAAGKDPRHRGEQFLGRPDGAVSQRGAAARAAAALQHVRARRSRPTCCPTAASTGSRPWAMERCVAACCRGGCGRIRFSRATTCAAPIRNSWRPGSRNIWPPCKGSIGWRRSGSASA